MAEGPSLEPALPVSFASLVVSLGSAALVHLGEVPDPGSHAISRDLKLARHSIDVLGMLQEKTRGNLDADESKLLEALLHELRSKYVAARKA